MACSRSPEPVEAEMAAILDEPQSADGIENEGNSSVFHEQLRNHFLNHSRGSSINLSFDLSSSSSSSTPESEDSGDEFREHILGNPQHIQMYIKEKLRYHFMSPLEKWRYRRVFPWKLVFQVIKIFVVTIQILLFGMDSTQFYKDEAATATALKAYFLQDWDPIRDVYFYPPTDGPYAVYTTRELCDSIDTVIQRYANVTKEPIGSFNYNSDDGSLVPPRLCFEYYAVVNIFPFNSTVLFDNVIKYRCLSIDPTNYKNFSIVNFLNETNVKMDVQRVITAKIYFTLKTLYRRSRPVLDNFVKYRMDTCIIFKNSRHDGMVEVALEVGSATNESEDFFHKSARSAQLIVRQALNAFVIILCGISLNLCMRSILRSHDLYRKTKEFFRNRMKLELSIADHFEFVDIWLCSIVLNDVLVTAGTIVKMTIDLQMISRVRFMYASVLLGTGLLLVWCGVIRYLGYFRTYNLLILTLKRSTPNLLKFLIGAMILFLGYAICGWAVLGPHHIKFKTFSSSMECLYAITNGDDIFATFSLATDEYANRHLSPMIWWFTRFYLYSFVILFICVVINLLYAVIIDAFEAIKELSDATSTKKKSLVQAFINEHIEKASSGNYLLDEQIEGDMSTFEVFSCWWQRRKSRNHLLLEAHDFERSEEATEQITTTSARIPHVDQTQDAVIS